MAIYNENLSGGINAKNCTADASKILDGYTAAVGKEIVTGAMPNNGDANSAIENGVLKEGYTSGGSITVPTGGNFTFKKVTDGTFTFDTWIASNGRGGSNWDGYSLGGIQITDYDASYVEGCLYMRRLRIWKQMVFTAGERSDGVTISSPEIFNIEYNSAPTSANSVTVLAIAEDGTDTYCNMWLKWHTDKAMLYYSSSDGVRATGYVTYTDYEVIYNG